MKSSVSIALFFLLSGFFLAALLSAIERSRRLLAVAVACLAAVVCIIVFLTPVALPSWGFGADDDEPAPAQTSGTTLSATTSLGVTTSLGATTSLGVGTSLGASTTLRATTTLSPTTPLSTVPPTLGVRTTEGSSVQSP